MVRPIVGVVVLALIVLYVLALTRYRKAGPNEALVVYGGRGKPAIIVGGGGFVWPLLNECASLSLEAFGLDWNPVTGKTADGATVTLDGVSQLKIDSTPEALEIAAEMLLDKTPEEIAAVARGAVNDGMLRFINERTEQRLRDLAGTLQMNAEAAQAVNENLQAIGLRVVTINVEEVQFGRE